MELFSLSIWGYWLKKWDDFLSQDGENLGEGVLDDFLNVLVLNWVTKDWQLIISLVIHKSCTHGELYEYGYGWWEGSIRAFLYILSLLGHMV